MSDIVPDYEVIDRDFQGKRLTEKNIKEIISNEVKRYMANLALYKRVKKFVIQDEGLPKTTTRKIKRHLVVSKLIADLEKKTFKI